LSTIPAVDAGFLAPFAQVVDDVITEGFFVAERIADAGVPLIAKVGTLWSELFVDAVVLEIGDGVGVILVDAKVVGRVHLSPFLDHLLAGWGIQGEA